MNSIQKLSLSLLLAIVSFSVFALFAYSGLFKYIESTFYDTKITKDIENNLEDASKAIKAFHENNFKKFETALKEESVKTIFLQNQSQENIFNRVNLFGKLLEENNQILAVRFVDKELKKIHFSTLDTDIKVRNKFSIEYKLFEEIEGKTFIKTLMENVGGDRKFFINGEGGNFAYLYKIFDQYEAHAGYGLVYVSKRGFQNFLLKSRILESGDQVVFIEDKGVLLRSQLVKDEAVLGMISDFWKGKKAERPNLQSEKGEKFFFFEKDITGFDQKLAIFVSEKEFEMQPVMRIILLASVFLSAFLLFFLILNIRQDATLVLSERVKKFQINLLREYLERKEEIDWQKWQSDLELRRDEVKQEIKRGIGKVKKEKQEQLDALVDKSWDEIIQVLGKRVSVEKRPSSLEIEKLESIIEKVISNFQTVGFKGDERKVGKKKKVLKNEEAVEEVEEAEAVEEVEEAEAVEEVEEAEAVEEVEEAEAVEEVEEAEAVEEVEEAEAVEEVEEAEAVEEVEEAEAVEEVEEAEAVEEVEEAEAAEEVEEAEAVEEVEEAEAVEEVEEAEAAEEIEEAEAAEEIEEAEAAEEIEEAVETVETVDEVEALEEVETVEELEVAEESGEALLEAVGQPGPIVLFEHRLFSQRTLPKQTITKSEPAGIVPLPNLAGYGKMLYLDFPDYPAADEMISEDENGVAEIKDVAFKKKRNGKEDFQNLVNEVIRDNVPEEEQDTKVTSDLGIDDLFGDFGLDIHQIVTSHDKVEEASHKDKEKPGADISENLFINGFLSMEVLFSRYRRDETGITKALVDISRRFSSYFCGLLILEEGVLEGKYSVGLDEKKFKNHSIGYGPYLGDALRGEGKILLIDWPIQKILELQGLIPGLDVSTQFYPLFLPIYYGNQKGLLFLSVREILSAENIKEIINKLAENKKT